MTKADLIALLDKVNDNARITIVLRDSSVVDVAEHYCSKAQEGSAVHEVFLHHAEPRS